MREIRAEVSDSFIKLSSEKAGVRGESNAARVRISFDQSWDGLAKKVTWWDARGLKAVEKLLTADLLENITASTRVYVTTVPPEAMGYAGRCTMVIDGCQGDVRTRSLSVGLEVSDAPIFNDPFIENDPTPSRAEQLQGEIDTLLEDISDRAADALSYKEAAAAEALKAKNYYEEALAAAGRAETAAEQAEDTLDEPHVTHFNGREGDVMPQEGDYTPQMVGADPAGSAAERVAKAGDRMTGELTAPELSVGDRMKYDGEDVGTMMTVGLNNFAAGNGAVAHGRDNVAIHGNIYDINEHMWMDNYTHFGFDTKYEPYVPPTSDLIGKYVLLITENEEGAFSRPVKVLSVWGSTGLRVEPVEGHYSKIIAPIEMEEGNESDGRYSSHAEGHRTAALAAKACHTEGIGTLATADGSHAEGADTKAMGLGSHAEGWRCVAKGKYSHAEGYGTIATPSYQHAMGWYNIEDKLNRYLVIVGNGYPAVRSNAYTLSTQGDGWFAGKVTVGNETKAANIPDPTAANELVTKAYADKAIAAAIQTATETFQGIIIALEARIAALEGNAQ